MCLFEVFLLLNLFSLHQVMLVLAADLSGETERERQALDSLLATLIGEVTARSNDDLTTRSANHEVQIVIMRLFTALLSCSKVSRKKFLSEL